jgi:hypothetical protein
MRTSWLAAAALSTLAATAWADDVTGFVVSGKGTLTGSVTDAKGKGIGKAKVHVASKSGERVVEADGNGRYRLAIDGESMVFVNLSGARIGGETAASEGSGGDEVITVHEMVPPAVMARPKDSDAVLEIPDYTDKAIDKNVWARAWMILDIDVDGAVKRVKFTNRPGFDLDDEAVKSAFKVKFEAAKDRAGKPMRSAILWTYEWPSYFWLKANSTYLGRLPMDVLGVNCQKAGETKSERRDCTGPDLTKTFDEKWIDSPPKKK